MGGKTGKDDVLLIYTRQKYNKKVKYGKNVSNSEEDKKVDD